MGVPYRRSIRARLSLRYRYCFGRRVVARGIQSMLSDLIKFETMECCDEAMPDGDRGRRYSDLWVHE